MSEFVSIPSTSLARALREQLPDGSLPGLEVAGVGYDPFGPYASLDSASTNLFDWRSCPTKTQVVNNVKYTVPDVVDVLPPDKASETVTIVSESVDEFQHEIAASAKISGSYLFFSGSLEAEFSIQSLTNGQNSVSRVRESINEWSIRLQDPESLRPYLRPEVSAALKNVTTQQQAFDIFTRWGTHFLTGVMLGGRAVYSSTTTKTSQDQTVSVRTQAELAYKTATGQVSGDISDQQKDAVKSFRSISDTRTSVLGGDSALASLIFSGDKDNFGRWRSSVAQYPTFVDFSGSRPMTGIWELCADEGSRSVIETAFESWGSSRSARLRLFPDYLAALSVVMGDDSNVPATPGYERIDFDLNNRAGGKYIYLCYRKESSRSTKADPRGISQLAVIFGENAQPPEGMKKLDVDLNAGAGGEYVYLCYRDVPWQPDACLTDVTIFGGTYASVDAPYGFTRLDGDLNAGAGGDFVYAAWAKTS